MICRFPQAPFTAAPFLLFDFSARLEQAQTLYDPVVHPPSRGEFEPLQLQKCRHADMFRLSRGKKAPCVPFHIQTLCLTLLKKYLAAMRLFGSLFFQHNLLSTSAASRVLDDPASIVFVRAVNNAEATTICETSSYLAQTEALLQAIHRQML